MLGSSSYLGNLQSKNEALMKETLLISTSEMVSQLIKKEYLKPQKSHSMSI